MLQAASRRCAQQRDVLRSALAPIAEEPLPPELDLARMIEPRRSRRLASRWAVAAAARRPAVPRRYRRLDRCAACGSNPCEGIVALAQEAAASYAVYAPDRVRPVEIRPRSCRSWSTGRRNVWAVRVTIPDLAASGYRFMGGRIVATAPRPRALFMYDDDHGTRLVMLTRPMAVDREHADGATRRTARSTATAGPTRGSATVSSGRPRPTCCIPLANEARRQIVRAT